MSETKMTKKKLENLINKHIDYEQLVRYEIEQLPNAGSECKCGSNETLYMIDYGKHFPEVHEYCTTCGGIRTP